MGIARAVAVTTVAFVAMTAPAAAQSLELLTDAPGAGGDPNDPVTFGAASADTSRFVFTTAERLLPSDTDNGVPLDAYARNPDGSFTHVSDHPTTNPDAQVSAGLPGISSDGTRAFFVTVEQLLSTDTDSSSDVYARNADGSLSLISDHPTTNPDAEVHAAFAGSSADGTRAFFTTAESLLAADTDSAPEIYARESNGSVTLLTDGTNADPDPGGAHTFGVASADGTRMYFSSNQDLVADDNDGSGSDAYVRNANGSFTLLSDHPTTVNDDNTVASTFAGVSSDESRVFFTSNEQLLPADTDTATDVYARDSGGLTLLTDNPATIPDANQDVTFGKASSDGTRLVFATDESLVTEDSDSRTDVYTRNPDGSFTLDSDNPAVDPDANFLNATFAGASADATRVFIQSHEQLVPGDTDAKSDVYAHNADGSYTNMTDHPTSNVDANFDSILRAASLDGSRILFTTLERLLPQDTDSTADVYASFPTPPSGGGGPTGGPTGGSPGGAGGGPGGSGVTGDLVAPAITSLRATPAVFRLGSALPKLSARKRPARTTLRFALSEAARVGFTFSRALPGRRAGRRCVKPARSNRTRKRCTRLVKQGTLTVSARRGTNRLRFAGRLTARRRLRAGRHRISAVAVDAAGNRSRPRNISITVLPA